MSLSAGSRLGTYEIVGALGSGGMGEVWRASDTKLGRDVALKVLPADFADDPERHARFEREARVLASLNHPNIATLYELEHLGEQHVLVMELVEGEGLDERIAHGPMPVDEAIPIALQIAEALEGAHEAGIVHRDLKPANVKVRPDGTVKVLDFGLAKAWDSEAADGSLSLSPTITQHHTRAGVILGTAAYMSPEQAKGAAVDKRADIWAFGVVLYEMLVGCRLFDGDSVPDTLAGVLRTEIDLATLPAETPVVVRRLLRQCLERRPRQRLRDIGDARIVLEGVLAGREQGSDSPPAQATAAPPRAWPTRLALVGLAISTVALGSYVVLDRPPGPKVVRASILPPPGTDWYLSPSTPGPATISPDGRHIAFTAGTVDGQRTLWVRAVDAIAPRELAGTENAQYPFWSPDGKYIGFFTEDSLKKVPIAGGPSIRLCGATQFGKGASWSPEGVIVFAEAASGPLSVVSAAGGEPRPLTALDPSANESGHRHPRFLPDGTHFLFVARRSTGTPSLRVGSLDGTTPVPLLDAPAQAEFAAGHLLFVRDGTLMAQPFDPDGLELRGEALPVLEGIAVIRGAALGLFSVSREGSLAYHAGTAPIQHRLVWRDRGGSELGILGEPGRLYDARISPDGHAVAAAEFDEVSGTSDLWLWNVERNLRSRFTFDPESERVPLWSPDGQTIAFQADSGSGRSMVCSGPTAGTAEPRRILALEHSVSPNSWTPDGEELVILDLGGDSFDLLAVSAEGGEPRPLLQTRFEEADGALSPDGRWLAYSSDETGRPEVYVTSFPEPGRKWQVSAGEGRQPVWRKDGLELFYRDRQALYAAEVNGTGSSFVVGAISRLFDLPDLFAGPRQHDVSADGQRVLVVEPMNEASAEPVTLVLNWNAELPSP